MAEKLGKIEKPKADHFMSKRKLYLVPLIFSGEKAHPEYIEKFNLYWEQVGEYVTNLELKIGTVNHIFHETITLAGENGLETIEKLSPASYQITRNKCQNGATFEATEDKELTEENMDWERFLLMGFISQKVAKVISEFYLETSRKRYAYIAQILDETLKANEVGILFIQEDHRVQFPQDIEVFSIAPPALDDIRRWQRDHTSADKRAEP